MFDVEEVRKKIIERMDLLDLIEVLEIEVEDIIDRFSEEIYQHKLPDILEYLDVNSEEYEEEET